ncbi:MAG: hypothetical protein ABIJ00_11945 [Candidatus Eisenbacteria bacterium]
MRKARSAIVLTVGLVLISPWAVTAGLSVNESLTHEYSVSPGTSYTGSITLKNTGDRPEMARVYQTDYMFYSDGTHVYGEPGGDPRSNADWVAFGPREVSTLPGAKGIIGYTIEVPPDSTLSGTYWSLLMIEEVPDASGAADGPQTQDVSMGITQVFRYGVQIVTHVGESGERNLEFLDTRLLSDGDIRTLRIDLENKGQRWLRPVLWTEVYNMEGQHVGRFEGGTLRIYPGTSVRYEVDLSELAKAHYNAVVVADCGGDNVFGAKYTLRVER